MAFFFNETKKTVAAKPKQKAINRAHIPINSLREMGCAVCPRDLDKSLKSPKLKPSGPGSADIYLLGTSPSADEDADNNHWTDKAGEAIYKKFGRDFMERNVRSNFITQCRGDQTAIEVECCRQRIVADIEETKPLVIVGIGDAPLAWATALSGNPSALQHRGTLFAVKVGRHVCYYYSILYPNFVNKKNYKKSEYEIVLEHDIAFIKDFVESSDFVPAKFYEGPYDAGIECITGTEPGDMQRLETALRELAQLHDSAIDIETTGLRPFMLVDPGVVSVAVGVFDRVVAFPIMHPDGWGTDAQRRQVWGLLIKFLMESGDKAAHNLAMEMEWLAYFCGTTILRRTGWDDTMAMAHTLDEREGTKGLEKQTVIHFGFDLKAQSKIDVTRENWWLQYDLKEILRYNGMDTKWTHKLRDHLMPKLNAYEPYKVEYLRKLRLAPTLVLTEIKGLPIDFDYAAKMKVTLTDQLEQVAARIKRTPEVKEYQQRFGTFEPTNPDHVLKLIKDLLKRPECRIEDRNGVRYSSDESVLNSLPPADVPSAKLVLEHRGAAKLLSTYIEPVVSRRIVCVDNVMRCKYSSMTAVTGRLASRDPNLQNFPKRKNKEIRGVVAAPRNAWMLACDYGQLEFRVVGMASEDDNVVKYSWTGYDVHKYWAERMVKVYPRIIDYIVEEFEVDWDELGIKTLRQEAKNGWVFPQLFGSSTRSCAEQLHLPDDVADDLGAEFWDEFKGAKAWQEKLLAKYERTGYVETLGGRRERGPLRKEQIINMPIQGTGCDIVTAAMDALSERADIEDDQDLQPNLNVHDDLTFVMPDAVLEDKLAIIAHEMCKPRFDYINVPLVVEASIGDRWHTLKEIKVYKSHELFGIANPYA